MDIAGCEVQKLQQTFTFEAAGKDKHAPLVEVFRTYCQGKNNIIVVRYRFNMFKQMIQDMETFIRELKHQVSQCDYGALENQLLRDQLVCGVRLLI